MFLMLNFFIFLHSVLLSIPSSAAAFERLPACFFNASIIIWTWAVLSLSFDLETPFLSSLNLSRNSLGK
jgi:hypothetical protein